MLLYIVLSWLGLLVFYLLALLVASIWLPDKPVTDEEAKEFNEFMDKWNKK